MKKITDLTSEDFPNVNPKKFEEWQKAFIEWQKAFKILPFLAIGLVVLQLIIGGAFFGIIVLIITFLYLFAYIMPLSLKAKRMLKEAGITNAEIQIKCKESV